MLASVDYSEAEKPATEGKSYLFNVEVESVGTEHKQGEIIPVKITIIDYSSLNGSKNATIEYSIQDAEGKVYTSKFEEISIDEKLIITRELKIPEDLPKGSYFLIAQLRYNEEVATGKHLFTTISGVKESKDVSGIWLIATLLTVTILLILAIITIVLKRRKHHTYNHTRREDLNKLARYVRSE